MPRQHRRFDQDPQDLGDVEHLLRRLDSRLATAEQKEAAAIPPSAPPPVSTALVAPAVQVHLFENVNVRLMTALGIAGLVLSIGIGAGKWIAGSETQTKGFESTLTALRGEIKGVADRIDRQNDSFYERMSFVFTDFCRRTERQNPNWSCADPITMPMDPAAGRPRSRAPSSNE